MQEHATPRYHNPLKDDPGEILFREHLCEVNETLRQKVAASGVPMTPGGRESQDEAPSAMDKLFEASAYQPPSTAFSDDPWGNLDDIPEARDRLERVGALLRFICSDAAAPTLMGSITSVCEKYAAIAGLTRVELDLALRTLSGELAKYLGQPYLAGPIAPPILTQRWPYGTATGTATFFEDPASHLDNISMTLCVFERVDWVLAAIKELGESPPDDTRGLLDELDRLCKVARDEHARGVQVLVTEMGELRPNAGN